MIKPLHYPGAFSIALVLFVQLSFAQTINVASGIKLVVAAGTNVVASGGIKIESSTGAIDNSGTIKLTGDWINNGSGLINGSNGTVIFNGTSNQSIAGSAATTFKNLTISNSNGVTLSKDATVSNALNFTAGQITTGANNVIMNAAGSVSGAGTGWVIGNMRWNFDHTHTSQTFVVGDATNYTPVLVAFNTVSSAGTLTGKTVSSEHPQINASGLSESHSVNRYWNLTNSGITFGTAAVTLNWVAADVDAGSTTSAFVVGKYDSPNWSSPAVASKTSTSIQATGVTSFSDFVVGESGQITFNASLFLQGFYLGNGKMSPLLKLLNITGAADTDVDTVTVELHNATSPYALAYSSTGILKTNGSLTCSFPSAASGNYYVVIKHRTALETWSSSAVSILNPYNFTTSASAAYGNKQVSLNDGKYAIYSGDITANGTTTGQDGSINILDEHRLQIDLPLFTAGEYTAMDITGDAFVDESDYRILENNALLNIAVSRP